MAWVIAAAIILAGVLLIMNRRRRRIIPAGGGGSVAAPVNTVAPVISGTAASGNTLSCTTGTWDNSPTSYTYQWQRDGDDIDGETANTYDLVDDDAETAITCDVTATNVGGSNTATSNTLTIDPLAPVNTVAPVVSGTKRLGQTLSTTNGTWYNSPSSYTYQWKRDGSSIGSATNSTYVLTIADVGADITCEVTATNDGGSTAQASNTYTMSAFLDFVIASACFEFPAWSSSAYPGSGQTLANVIASPNCGSAQADYDAWLGADTNASSDDPTFSTNKFTIDGGDKFTFKSLADAEILLKAHQTDQSGFWFLSHVKITAWGTGLKAIFGTYSTTTGSYGLDVFFTANEELKLTQCVGGSEIAVTISGTGAVTDGNDYLILVSFNPSATTNNIRAWINTTTKTQVSLDMTDTTTAANRAASIMAYNITGAVMKAGETRLPLAGGNAFLDDADAANLFAYVEHYTGLDFTP